MERLIRRLLLAWLLLLAGVLVAYHYGYAQLAYRLLWAVAIGSPVAVVALLWLVGLRLRGLWHRVRVLRRARHWRRPARPWDPDDWSDYPGAEEERQGWQEWGAGHGAKIFISSNNKLSRLQIFAGKSEFLRVSLTSSSCEFPSVPLSLFSIPPPISWSHQPSPFLANVSMTDCSSFWMIFCRLPC